MSPQKEMVRVMRDVYGLDAPDVFDAMLQVPRERFVDDKHKHLAYFDTAIPIGHEQTISQPFTVAFMTNLLDLTGDEKVLEVGTGSGYQAAVLAELSKDVFTIEVNPKLAKKAKVVLNKLNYKNIKIKTGNGNNGWKKYAPFQRIIITAAVEKEVPKALFEQLGEGGVLVSPVGKTENQIMTKYVKKNKTLQKSEHGKFVFVSFKEDS